MSRNNLSDSENDELQTFKEHIIAQKIVEEQEQRKPINLKNFNLKEFIETQLGQRVNPKQATAQDWAEHNRLVAEFLKKKPVAEYGFAAMRRKRDESAQKKNDATEEPKKHEPEKIEVEKEKELDETKTQGTNKLDVEKELDKDTTIQTVEQEVKKENLQAEVAEPFEDKESETDEDKKLDSNNNLIEFDDGTEEKVLNQSVNRSVVNLENEINSIISKLSSSKNPLSINCKNKTLLNLKTTLSKSTTNVNQESHLEKNVHTSSISNQNSPLQITAKPFEMKNMKHQQEVHAAHIQQFLASKQIYTGPNSNPPAQFVYQSNFMNYPTSFMPQKPNHRPPGIPNAFNTSQTHYWNQMNQNPYLDPETNTYYNPYISFNNGYALFDHSATAPPNFQSTPNPYDHKQFHF